MNKPLPYSISNHLNRKRFSLFESCLYLCFIFGILSVHPVLSKQKREMRWEKAETLVGKKVYGSTYRDSLKKVYSIENVKGLRTIEYAKPKYTKEKLVYDGGWGFLKAGFGIFDMTVDANSEIILLEGRAVTNNFVSAFYKVRDYVRSPIDFRGLYPLFFEQHVQENRYIKNTWVIYDHQRDKVYSNRAKEKREYDVLPFTHNYLSLLYFLRTIDFAPKDTFSINCFVHGKDYAIFFRAHEREMITVKAGTFQCIKVEPRLVGEGKGFTKRDRMYLWLTDDKNHILVMAKSKIALGWISAHLIHLQRE